jgi:ribonuclease VapC
VISVDALALLAIGLNEPDGDQYLELLAHRGGVISPVNWWEAAVRMRTFHGESGLRELERILTRLDIRIAPTDDIQAQTAFEAHVRFGRGTPAALNLGDCFAYALAAAEGDGLLFKGEDFLKTDVRSALPATGP